MALSTVYMAADVYLVCLQHGLSTEKEEVMGLLLGDIDSKKVAHISAVIMLRRSDKRKDRVEISPEQLSNAAIEADKLSKEIGQPLRVVGWYHSHPHITVVPSHIDVRTQAMYQMMDECFVGIIFSLFTEDKSTKEQQVQVTCFQSINQSPEGEAPQFIALEVPLHIKSTEGLSRLCLRSMVELPEILFQEEKDSYDATTKFKNLSILAQLNNQAVLTKSLCHITEVVSGPLVTALEQRKANNEKRYEELLQEKQKLIELKAQS